MIDDDVPIVSVHTIDVDYAYPIPTLGPGRGTRGRRSRGSWSATIYSRGRFGSWRYEIGNMDHAAKMGIDAARLLVEGRPEELWPL